MMVIMIIIIKIIIIIIIAAATVMLTMATIIAITSIFGYKGHVPLTSYIFYILYDIDVIKAENQEIIG